MNKQTKKFLALTACVATVFAFSACSSEKNKTDKEVKSDLSAASSAIEETEILSDAEADTSEKTDMAEEVKEETKAETPAEQKETKTEEKPKTEAPKETAPSQTPVQTEAPVAPAQTAPAAPAVQEPAPAQTAPQTPAPAPEAPAVTAATASKYIGQSVSALVAAIGQPNGKTYASSCIGDGQDGEWYYPGFTVYTYKDTNGYERVEDVF